MSGFESLLRYQSFPVHSGHIGYGLFLRHWPVRSCILSLGASKVHQNGLPDLRGVPPSRPLDELSYFRARSITHRASLSLLRESSEAATPFLIRRFDHEPPPEASGSAESCALNSNVVK